MSYLVLFAWELPLFVCIGSMYLQPIYAILVQVGAITAFFAQFVILVAEVRS